MLSVTRLKQISSVLFFQSLSFGISFASSIFLVRNLSKGEYALFTITMMLLGMLNALSDSGLTVGFRRLGGKYSDSPALYSFLCLSLYKIRKQILFGLMPVVGGIAFILFYKESSSIYHSVSLVVLTLILAFLEIERSMRMEILRVQMEVQTVQNSEMLMNLLRLCIVVAAITLISIEIAIMAYIVSSMIGGYYLRWRCKEYIKEGTNARSRYVKIYMTKFKELFPNTVFYIFQSQISLFILTFVFSSNKVADYGALSRFAVIFTTLNAVTLNVFAPRFSKYQDLYLLKKKFFQLVVLFITIGAGMFLIVFLIGTQILTLLGDQYSGLEKLLLYVVFGNIVGYVFGNINILNSSRAWVYFNARFAIPVSIAALVAGAFLLDLTKVENVVLYSALPIFCTGFLKLADALKGLKIISSK